MKNKRIVNLEYNFSFAGADLQSGPESYNKHGL